MKNFVKVSLAAAAFGMFAAVPVMADESFGGIGVTIYQQKDGVKVAEVIPGTPAAETKLQAGDVITAVDGVSLAGQDIEASKDMLRGQVNKPLEITYISEGETYTAVLRRAQLTIKDLESEKVQAWYGENKNVYSAQELEVIASASQADKQLVAVLQQGSVVNANATVSSANLNGVFVEKADEFAPKASKSLAKPASASLVGLNRKSVSFNLKSSGVATVTIMSADGEQVATLRADDAKRGFNTLSWNADNLPSGRYMVTIEHNGSVSGKFAVLK